MPLPRVFQWRSPRSLRRARVLCGLIAIALAATISFTLRREIGVHNHRGWFACVGSGVLQVGYHGYRSFGSSAFYRNGAWNDDWTLAWRPFHAMMLNTPGGNVGYRFIVVPLWPFGCLALACSAFAHGKLVAIRQSRELSCRTCGYDLSRISVQDNVKRCPECGVTTAPLRDSGALAPAPPVANPAPLPDIQQRSAEHP